MKKGWEIKKLGEIILENKKSTLKSKGNEEGVYPFFISGMKVKTYNKSIIDGQNIYLPTGGNFYVHFYEGKASYSTDTWSVKTDKNTDIKYFYFFLLLNRDFINEKHFKGATIKHLQKNDFREIKIPLPPLPEQQRIVAILDDAFAAIAKAKANAQQNLKNAKELFESYLQGVFENGNWEKKRWGELCDFVRGPFGGSLKKNIFKEDGYVVYEQKHAIHDHFNQLRYFIDEAKFNEMKRFELFAGDIIMSCSGVTLGRVAIVPEGLKRGIINQALLKLTPKKNVSVHFIKHWLRSNIFQKIIFDYSGGAAIPNVPAAKILKDILIPCPSPKEQDRIVNEIETVLNETKRLEIIYEKKINGLEELKKSVLQKAYSGQLKIEKLIMK